MRVVVVVSGRSARSSVYSSKEISFLIGEGSRGVGAK